MMQTVAEYAQTFEDAVTADALGPDPTVASISETMFATDTPAQCAIHITELLAMSRACHVAAEARRAHGLAATFWTEMGHEMIDRALTGLQFAAEEQGRRTMRTLN